MKKYTQQEINNIPDILKCHWYQKWIDEVKAPSSYLGKLAILITEKGEGKAPTGKWITEEIDFIITDKK